MLYKFPGLFSKFTLYRCFYNMGLLIFLFSVVLRGPLQFKKRWIPDSMLQYCTFRNLFRFMGNSRRLPARAGMTVARRGLGLLGDVVTTSITRPGLITGSYGQAA